MTPRFWMYSTLATLAMTAFQPAQAQAMSDEEFNSKVRAYILANPDVIQEAVTRGVQLQKEKELLAQKAVIDARAKDLYSDPESPSVGPKDADATVVEFFDYNCGACKMMFRSLEILLEEDKNVRVVFKEFPIFGERSELLARLSHAVYRLYPKKYMAYHGALMRVQGAVDLQKAYETAKALKMDEEKLKVEATKPAIEEAILRDRQLGMDLGVRGTPNLVLDGELIPGAIDIGALRAKVKAMRAQ